MSGRVLKRVFSELKFNYLFSGCVFLYTVYGEMVFRVIVNN